MSGPSHLRRRMQSLWEDDGGTDFGWPGDRQKRGLLDGRWYCGLCTKRVSQWTGLGRNALKDDLPHQSVSSALGGHRGPWFSSIRVFRHREWWWINILYFQARIASYVITRNGSALYNPGFFHIVFLFWFNFPPLCRFSFHIKPLWHLAPSCSITMPL